MNAEAIIEPAVSRKNGLPQPVFAIACVLLLALGLGVWKATNDIGNAHDEAAKVWKLSNPLAMLRTR